MSGDTQEEMDNHKYKSMAQENREEWKRLCHWMTQCCGNVQ
jgi:uncharacterized cysteine cluster protein YcgN (CxxCxxCC family)